MKRYLLDTGIMGHFINHRHGVDGRVRDARRQGARIGTCMPVVGELFAGVELSNCTVVTTDSDLASIPDLTVENWLSS